LFGFEPGTAEFSDGKVSVKSKKYLLSKAAESGELIAEDEMTYGELSKEFAQDTFGAHFVEVAVNKYTCEIRVQRMLAVCHAGNFKP